MHLPSYAKPVGEFSRYIHLLLIGVPGSGKTYSTVTTFPNPLVVNIDNGLTNEDIRKLNVPTIAFYDPALRKAIAPGAWKTSPAFANVANQMTEFLSKEALKLTSEQTLIIDSLSTLADGIEKDLWAVCPRGKDGTPDGFAFWKNWADWFCGFCDVLKNLQCNVVLIAHEQEVRDAETGRVLQYMWSLPGQKFSNRLGQFFTDVYRQIGTSKETSAGSGKFKRDFKWQVLPDDKFPFCKTRMNTEDKFVPATYKSFDQYKA